MTLDDLVAFLEHPVKGFLTQRVGLSLFAGDDEPADALPIAPDGLATWAIGDRMLADRLAGRDLDRCRQAEWRRGDLPPGALGDRLLATVLEDVEPLVSAAAEYRVGEPADRDVDVELPDGTRVVGTVGGLYGDTALRVEYSRLTPKQRIRSWVRLLALTAATGEPWPAVTVGQGRAVRHRPRPRSDRCLRTRPAPCWPSWWRCGRPGCVHRCRCPPSPGTRTRGSAGAGRALPTRWPRPRVRGRTGRAPSAPTPHTNGCGVEPHPPRS